MTSAISWRASFILQVLIVATIIVHGACGSSIRRARNRPRASTWSARSCPRSGLFFVVLGILQSSTYGWFAARTDFTIGDTVVIPEGGVSPVWIFVAIGAADPALVLPAPAVAGAQGEDPLIATRLFRNRTSNRGLATQLFQWLILQGSFFVISVFVQQVRGYDAIQTGLILSPAIVGILASSAAAGRLARRRTQTWLIRAGFVTTTVGIGLFIALVREDSSIWTFVPGLLLIGAGVGVMLTSSVNVVQSAFPERDQGDISGLSRSVSNLGSSLGVALAGSIIAAASIPGGHPFALSLTIMLVISVIGVGIAFLLPNRPGRTRRAVSADREPVLEHRRNPARAVVELVVEVHRRADQRKMAERLREVADLLARRCDLLREEPERAGVPANSGWRR